MDSVSVTNVAIGVAAIYVLRRIFDREKAAERADRMATELPVSMAEIQPSASVADYVPAGPYAIKTKA